LNTHKVEYLIVGGYAVAYHGYPRATADLDVWVAASPDNAERTVEALRAFGFDMPQLTPGLLIRESHILRMGVPPVRLEVLTSISGVEFRACYGKRVVTELDGVRTNIIDLESLRANKRAAGRFKDLDDLENLPG